MRIYFAKKPVIYKYSAKTFVNITKVSTITVVLQMIHLYYITNVKLQISR